MHYRFGVFSLDTDRRELRRESDLLAVEPKVFDLLVHLIANRERVVGKDDLIAAIWGGRIVSESALTTCVNAVRRAIGDDGKTQQRIKTLPRKGFRFVGDVREDRDPGKAGVEFSLDTRKPPLALLDKPSIAVLPFTNLSGDPEQEYFTDGITEDIITELSRFHSLFVIARNSSFSYKAKSPDIRQVGRELGVRYVLEGSIRKSADRVRVTGQLIDTLTGNHIWAERYDRVLEGIFELQEEFTKAIVGAIAPQIESAEQSKASRRHAGSLTAYEMALRSRAHALEGYDKTDQALIVQSIREAKEALSIDPDSVPALHALARAHGNALLIQLATDPEHAVHEATWAVTRAIELDATDAFAYALRGFIVMLSYQWDRFPAALADAGHAHEMNPNDPTVLRFLAALEAGSGDGERAIEHLLQALRLSPRQSRSHEIYQILAYASFVAKRYSEGIAWAVRALNDMPTFPPTHQNLVACLVGAGEIDKAKAAFARGQKLAPAYFRSRLDGLSASAHPEDRRRHHIFFRIAAGLEDPSAADAVR